MEIIVVEDEQKMAHALQEALLAEGHRVRVAHTGEEGFYLLHTQAFDLAILDIMLPGHDGFEILSTLRRRGILIPVLLVTARDAIEDRVRGLDIGADDYLVKPFALAELLARVRVLLRRGKAGSDELPVLADLQIDFERRLATRAGQHLDLTVREFDLLGYLFANAGRVVSREMLARDVWKETGRHTPIDNVIDAQMVRLRRKVDGQFDKKLLHTVRGVGFILRDSEHS